MKKVLVGFPLLGKEEGSSSRSFKPLVVPDCRDPSNATANQQKFLLLPSAKFISVLSLATGKTIAFLAPKTSKKKEKSKKTTSLVSTTCCYHDSKRYAVSLCSDGTVLLFDLEVVFGGNRAVTKSKENRLSKKGSSGFYSLGEFHVSTPVHFPARVLKFKQNLKLLRLAASSTNGYSCAPSFYAVVKEKETTNVILVNIPSNKDTLEWSILTKQPRSVLNPDTIFHFEATSTLQNVKEGTQALRTIVILATPASAFFIYDGKKTRVYSTIPDKRRQYCSVDVSPNGHDIAFGMDNGVIEVWHGALLSVFFASSTSGIPQSPSPAKQHLPKKITQKLHWHAHPVNALQYTGTSISNDPMLYSGADESVLLSWRCGHGGDKPTHTLPRIALGGIASITGIDVPGGGRQILVYCSDDSLHLFEAHTFAKRWHRVGICQEKRSPGDISHLFANDFTKVNTVVISGLNSRPGRIEWFDVQRQAVVQQLDAAIFNRVSRLDPEEKALAVPKIEHMSLSDDSRTLLTVDTISTEDYTAGTRGSLRSLRFWAARSNGTEAGYVLLATMTNPHGLDQDIVASALSPDGQSACTVSKSENCCRVWSCGSERLGWHCQYKASTPYGLRISEANTRISFSSDSSLLAISYHDTITLWDHKNQTFLKRLKHGEKGASVLSLAFLRNPSAYDLILSTSAQEICVQTVFGSQGPSNLGWSWNIAASSAVVAGACGSVSTDCIAVAVNQDGGSYVLLADAATGRLWKRGCIPIISSTIESIIFDESLPRPGFESDIDTKAVVVLESGEILSLETKDRVDSHGEKRKSAHSQSDLPALPLPTPTSKRIKRETVGNYGFANTRMASNPFAEDTDLPLLSAIVHNVLKKKLDQQ